MKIMLSSIAALALAGSAHAYQTVPPVDVDADASVDDMGLAIGAARRAFRQRPFHHRALSGLSDQRWLRHSGCRQ